MASRPTNSLLSVVDRLIQVRPDERAALLWSCAYMFCLLCSYSVLRPVREAMAVVGGTENVTWLWTGTFVLTTVFFAPLFAWAVSKWPRRRFVPIVYCFIASNLVLFSLLWLVLDGEAKVWLGRAFYMWVSAYVMFVLSVFWSVMVDVFDAEQGKRLFAPIAVGGTIGAITGSSMTAIVGDSIDTWILLLLAGAVVEIALVCAQRVLALDEAHLDTRLLVQKQGVIGGHFWSGVVAIGRSPYLLGIAGFIFLMTLMSAVLYMEKIGLADARREALSDAGLVSFFAMLDTYEQVATLIIQLFLTGRIMRWMGVGWTLAVLPLICIGGFSALALAPGLVVFVIVNTIYGAGRHAFARPAREVLFTAVSREDKYKSKNLIDTAVYRGGDVVNLWSYQGLAALAPGLAGVSVLMIPFAIAWGALAVLLGAKQRR